MGFPALPVPGFRAEEELGSALESFLCSHPHRNARYSQPVHIIKSDFTWLCCSAKFKTHTTAQGTGAHSPSST